MYVQIYTYVNNTKELYRKDTYRKLQCSFLVIINS